MATHIPAVQGVNEIASGVTVVTWGPYRERTFLRKMTFNFGFDATADSFMRLAISLLAADVLEIDSTAFDLGRRLDRPPGTAGSMRLFIGSAGTTNGEIFLNQWTSPSERYLAAGV